MAVRSTDSYRIQNSLRRLKFLIAPFVVKAAFWIIYRASRNLTIIGNSQIDKLLETGKPFLPCYWHQQALFCAYYLLKQKDRGLNLGFLVSPSEDGDIGTKLIESWGARSIRGSSSGTGAQALRDLYYAITRENISVTTTPDGPRGPIFEFKSGMITLARLTGAPILPMAYATDRAWTLRSWDRFFIPKPFSRIVILIGEPIKIPDRLTEAETKLLQDEMAERLNQLSASAKQQLDKPD